MSQRLAFSIQPPIRKGEITVLLKKNDEINGSVGQQWKVLGRQELKSSKYKRYWTFQLRKRVPVGQYMMKLSMALGEGQLEFSETMPIAVTRSTDDTADLLQEILKGE